MKKLILPILLLITATLSAQTFTNVKTRPPAIYWQLKDTASAGSADTACVFYMGGSFYAKGGPATHWKLVYTLPPGVLPILPTDTAAMLAPLWTAIGSVTSPFQGTMNITTVAAGANLSVTGGITTSNLTATGSVTAANLNIANWNAAYTGRFTTVSATNLTGSYSGNTLTISLSGAQVNAALGYTAASSVATFTLGSTSIALGSTTTTIAGLTSVTSTTFVGALTGNASTATSAATLTTARNIQGVSFNGSANIDIINGTGFVKASGTTISYDNSTYLTTTTAGTTYLPLAGGTLTGALTISYTSPSLVFNRTATNQYMTLAFKTSGSGSWDIYTENDATPNLIFYSYGKSGGAAVLTADYTTGAWNFQGNSVTGGAASFTTGGFSGNVTLTSSDLVLSYGQIIKWGSVNAISYSSGDVLTIKGASNATTISIAATGTTTVNYPMLIGASTGGPMLNLNASGANYGQIQNTASQTWGLGSGSTLTGISTTALTWNASNAVTIAGAFTTNSDVQIDATTTGSGNFTIGPTTPSANGTGRINLINSNSVRNWRIAMNDNVADAFEIIPSTINGGSSFTTAALKIIGSTGAMSISGDLTLQNTKGVYWSTTEGIIGNASTHVMTLATNNVTAITISSSQAVTTASSVTATSFIKSGGTSAQYLMADGSVSTGTGTSVVAIATITAQTTTQDICSYAVTGGDKMFLVGGQVTFVSGTGQVSCTMAYTAPDGSAQAWQLDASQSTPGTVPTRPYTFVAKSGTTVYMRASVFSGIPTYNASGFIQLMQ